MTATQHFVFALVEDFTHLALACATEPLRIANLISNKPLYRWSYASLDGLTARSSDNCQIKVHNSFCDMPDCDRLFILSGIGMQFKDHTVLLTALRRKDRLSRVCIGALCSGSWILARGGFLNGQNAAIHWEFHDSFMEEFPEVNLVRSVFVAESKYPTASGGTATADLMLHLIAQDHGRDLSISVADQMVYNAVREATAAQKVSLQSRSGVRDTNLSAAVTFMSQRLDQPLSPSMIARELGISTRQLERLFGKYLNTSPKKYYMEMRLERARNLLVQTEKSVTEVAMACGFDSAGYFSRVYRTAYGVTPTMQRSQLS
ncbi:GlxA family transcriptional regulator [Ahrensia kielensis]|uniref:GlxA family transcriptional regulator n=1 Tax=Ahrensia kielensis TaxID=76980 RepID=A0ABU9TAZ9_9HYPH